MDQMLSFQIMDDLNQNPILKNMVSSLISNTFLIEKMIYILTIIKYNTLVRNQVQSQLQVSPINFQNMNQNLMMNNIPSNPMMSVASMNKPRESGDYCNPINIQGMNQNPMMSINPILEPNFNTSNPMMMMMMDSMNKPKESEDSQKDNCISVIFRASGKNKIVILGNRKEKVSNLIEKYRIKSGDRDLSKKFIFNAKALNCSLTLEEAEIDNNSNVFVVEIKSIDEKKV